MLTTFGSFQSHQAIPAPPPHPTPPHPHLLAPCYSQSGELDLLEKSLVKLCLEHSKSLSEVMLSENGEDSTSFCSFTHCFSLFRGILYHFGDGGGEKGKRERWGEGERHRERGRDRETKRDTETDRDREREIGGDVGVHKRENLHRQRDPKSIWLPTRFFQHR